MKRSNNYELFTTESAPNGTSALIVVNKTTNEVVATVEEALFGATSSLGDSFGVYAETCGGYSNQIHGAAYLGYEDVPMFASNLNPYECDCDECEIKGYDDSECERKDWSEIDWLDSIADDGDITKLYWIELDAVIKYAATSPTNDGSELFETLNKYFDETEIKDAIEFVDSDLEFRHRFPWGGGILTKKNASNE